jgi:hypothetical protein
MAMFLIVPDKDATGGTARIVIEETAHGARLVIDTGFERSVLVNVCELRRFAAMANTIARRVANRPEWRP